MMSKWLPIESAPKDGENVMLYAPTENYEVCIGWYGDTTKKWFACGSEATASDGAGDWQTVYQPTHWMPLPAPPTDATP